LLLPQQLRQLGEVGRDPPRLVLAQLMHGAIKRRALLNHFPGGVYAPAALAAFSAMPLNSLGVQARTVSILDTAPLAEAAIPTATASDPSANSETSTASFEPVV